MILGAHFLIYSHDPHADRAFFRDVLGWPYVLDGPPEDDWLIFRLPPAELGVHPTEEPPHLGVYLMCDDLEATLADLRSRGVSCGDELVEQDWGTVGTISLPSGAPLRLYQPRHVTPVRTAT